jgi:hypothetical protein
MADDNTTGAAGATAGRGEVALATDGSAPADDGGELHEGASPGTQTVRPPVGAAFELGWSMAQLFGPLPPDTAAPGDHLPAVSELGPEERLKVAIRELRVLAGPFGDFGADIDAVPASWDPKNRTAYQNSLRALHDKFLEAFVGDRAQMSSYQLGRDLSDTCWLPTQAQGSTPFLEAFDRPHVAELCRLLDEAGGALPVESSAVAARSIQNWQDWADVNAPVLKNADNWAKNQDLINSALHSQNRAWRALLTAQPGKAGSAPSVNAWVRAGESILRTSRLLGRKILRHFWPVVVVVLVATGGLLYLAITHTSGTSTFWASLVTVAGAFGVSGASLRAAAQKVASGAEQECWNAAVLDARAWEVTWMPTLPQGIRQRYRLSQRGVDPPQMKKGLEGLSTRPQPKPVGEQHAGTPGVGG